MEEIRAPGELSNELDDVLRRSKQLAVQIAQSGRTKEELQQLRKDCENIAIDLGALTDKLERAFGDNLDDEQRRGLEDVKEDVNQIMETILK